MWFLFSNFLLILIINITCQTNNSSKSTDIEESDFLELITLVPSNKKDCFYYKPKCNFLIEYRVLYGGHGDVALFIEDPRNNRMFPPGDHRMIKVAVHPSLYNHAYRICFDNRQTSPAVKKIVFRIESEIKFENEKLFGNLAKPMSRVHRAIRYVREGLFHQRNRGIIDQVKLKGTVSMITWWFSAQLIVLLFCTILRILMIRKMFEVKRK